MNRHIHSRRMIVALAACVCAFATTSADAQVSTNRFVRSYILDRPTVSPYLNLLRNDGINGIANYQTLVRPQLQFREQAIVQERQIERVQQRINVQQSTIEDIQQQRAQRVFSTGHPTRFMNYQSYYPGFSALQRR